MRRLPGVLFCDNRVISLPTAIIGPRGLSATPDMPEGVLQPEQPQEQIYQVFQCVSTAAIATESFFIGDTPFAMTERA